MKKILHRLSLTGILILAVLFAQAQTSWTGAFNSDWATANNWTNGTPTASVPAILGDANFTGSNQPTISTTANCAGLTIGGSVASILTVNKSLIVSGNVLINANGTLTQKKATITLTGNWTKNGTFNFSNNSSPVTFSGITQTISGTSINSFRRLNINTNSTVILNSNVSVSNAFSLNGTLNPSEGPTFAVSGGGTLTVGNGGTLKVNAATFAGNYSIGIVLGIGSTVDYSSTTSSQTVSAAYTYATLKISGTGIKTLAGNLSALNSTSSAEGNILVVAGILDLANFTANRATSVSGGTLSVANGATLRIGGLNSNFFPANFLTVTLNLSSTVEYDGSGTQLVASQTYGNLLLSSASGASVRTLPSSAFTITGNFTSSVNAGSLSYQAASAILIGGNVTIGASATFNGGSVTVTNKGNWINNGSFVGNTGTVVLNGPGAAISGTGVHNFNNLTFTASGVTSTGAITLNLSGNLATTGPGEFTQGTGGTLIMTGTSKTISGTGIILENFSVTTGSVTSTSILTVRGHINVTGSFIASVPGDMIMTGASKTITNSGTLTFSSLTIPLAASVTTASSFSISTLLDVSGSLTASANTVSFIGNSSLNGIVNLFNVTVNPGMALQLAANSVLGIANVFTLSGTLNVTTSKPNTVNYNGGNQSIVTTIYDNLTFSTGGIKTALAGITVNADITIGAGTTFSAGSFTHNIFEDWINNGMFTGTSTIILTGSQNASVSGVTAFNILTVNKTSPVNVVSLNNNVSAVTVNMTKGIINAEPGKLTITNTRTGIGYIYGTITRTHSFTAGTAYAFEGVDNTIAFAASGVTSVTMKITRLSVDDFPFGGAINRSYDISNVSGVASSATLRLHYEDVELNGNDENSTAFKLWRNVGSWLESGRTAANATNNFVEQSGILSLLGRWTLSDDAIVFNWTGNASSVWNQAANWTVTQGNSGTGVPTANDIAQIGVVTFINQPIITTTATIKSLLFGSAKNAILTLNTGGSLTVVGNISGTFVGINATHNLNTGTQNLTVNGDLVLSNGNVGRAINLNIGSGTVSVAGSVIQSGGANISFSAAGILNIGNNFTYSSGTFSAGTGTTVYNGVGAQGVAAVPYFNLNVNKSSGIATINSITSVAGNLTIQTGELDINNTTTITGNVNIVSSSSKLVTIGAAAMLVSGNWINTGGSFTAANGTVTFNGLANQSITAVGYNNLVISKPSGIAVLNSNVTINNNLTVTSGTLNLTSFSANRLTTGGTFTLTNSAILLVSGADNFPKLFGTYTLSNTSTVEYNGTVAQNVAGVSYGHLTLSNTSTKTLTANSTVNGNIVINASATFAEDAFAISLYGNWTNNGNFTHSLGISGGIVLLYGTSKTITGTTIFNRLTIYGSYTVSAGSNLTFNSDTKVLLGSNINFGSNPVIISGDLTIDGFLVSNGIATFTGNIVQNIRLSETGTYSSSSAGVVNYNGSRAPIFNSSKSPQYATVNINNTNLSGINPNIGWVVHVAINIKMGSVFNGGIVEHNFRGYFTNNGTVTSTGMLNFFPQFAVGSIQIAGESFKSTGTVNFGGLAGYNILGAATFNDVLISNKIGVTPNSSWTVNKSFVGDDLSVFNAGSFNYNVAGDIISNGTLNGGTSRFIASASGGQISGSPGTTFYNLSTTAGSTLSPISFSGDFNVNKNFTNTGILDASGGTMIFTGSENSTIGGNSIYDLQQFDVYKSPGAIVTLTSDITNGNSYSILSGTLDLSDRSITGEVSPSINDFSASAGTFLKIGGTNSFPTAFATVNLDSLSTVEYYGTNQSVAAASANVNFAYGNLILSTGGTKTAAGALNVKNNFTLSTATFAAGAFSHSVAGHWTMTSGSFNHTGIVSFNGGAVQNVSSTGAFSSITINKTASYVNLLINITANGNLLFTSGLIYTNDLILNVPTGTVTASQATGWVNGRLQKNIATGGVIKIFEIGDATSFTPVTVNFANVTTAGNLVVRTRTPDHPQILSSGINPNQSVNRYWDIVRNAVVFTTATVTLNWVAADVDAGSVTSSFIPSIYNGTTWSFPTFTLPAATSIQVTALTGFGEFVVGQRGAKVWTGAISNLWNVNSNWNPALVPANGENVIIPPSGRPDVLINTSFIGNNISITNPNAVVVIDAGRMLVVNGLLDLAGILSLNGQTLTLNGTYTRGASGSGLIRGSKTSNLIIGSAFKNTGSLFFFDQAAATFNNYLKNFTINSTLTIGNTLNIAAGDGINAGTITLGTNVTLNTNDFLTLKSDNTGTARIAELQAANAFIIGNVSIERFIPGRRAWRLLSAPVASAGAPTINASWQEGGVQALGTLVNPNPGFGTHITGGTFTNGFDQNSINVASLKYYDPVSNTLIGVPSTHIPITKYSGYYLFVGGDRSTNLALGATAPKTNTVLRMKGKIVTGDVSVPIAATNFTLVGNPYPSAVDFATMTKNNVRDIIYIWDPKLYGAYGVGGYVTGILNDISKKYVFTTSVSPVSQYIASGEAFFVPASSTPGTLVLKESDKTTLGSDLVFGRENFAPASLRIDLYAKQGSGSKILADAVLALYNEANSNSVNESDAEKLGNSGENLTIRRDNKLLAIEKRKFENTGDTIFLNATRLQKTTYILDIMAQGMDTMVMKAFLKDKYDSSNNNKPIDLSGGTVIDFTVTNDPASSASDRFSIVFIIPELPFKFVANDALLQQNAVSINWKIENENKIESYTIQSSSDNFSFKDITTIFVNPSNNMLYNWVQQKVTPGVYYYRIRANAVNETSVYSTSMRVEIIGNNTSPSLDIRPNQVTGNQVQLFLSEIPKGNYNMDIYSISGQLVKSQRLEHNGGAVMVPVLLPTVAKGIYRVRLTNDKKIYSTTFIKI